MSAKIQGIPHASVYAWRIPVHYFTVIAKIHPKSPSAMDFGTPESLPYGQREAPSCRLVPLEDTFLIFAGSRPLELLKYADKCVAVHKAGHLRDVRNF